MPECIENMGNKSNARDIMIKAGVPVVPGSKGAIKDEKEVIKNCKRNRISCNG